jgi:type II secretion system protein H
MRTGRTNIARFGFTLVEMLVVVLMAVLLAGLGGGIWTGTYGKIQVEKAVRDFVLAAKYARITAIEEQSPCKLELDTENSRFVLAVYGLDPTTGQTEELSVADSYFARVIEFDGDVEFEDVRVAAISRQALDRPDVAQAILFLPNGTSQSAVVQIGDGKHHMTVSICAATGRAKVQPGTAENVSTGIVDLDERL